MDRYSHYSSICANGQQTYRQTELKTEKQSDRYSLTKALSRNIYWENYSCRQTDKKTEKQRETDKCSLIKTHNVM